MCLPLTFLFSLFSSPSFPQIAVGLHALWDNDLTDDIPAKCVTSGTVAGPHFHFVAAFKPPVMGVSVDWIEVKEVTNDHPVTPSVYTPNLSSAQPSPQCASLLGISDPQNWQWVFGDVPAGPHAFTYHNTTYQVTVQYRYRAMGTPPPYPPPMQQYGPFQISITVNVQNLVVNSGDERKLLKWDPERPEICDTNFNYSIECAQKKMVSVTISIYSTEGPKVYEVTEQKVCPGSYTFTWDGSVNMMPIPPDGKAKKGLYSFDIQVIGPAYYYDADWLRSRLLRVGEHEVKFITPRVIEGWYVLYSNRDASEAWMEVYDPDLEKVTEAMGTTHAIPENATPTEQDWNKTVRAWAGFDKVGIWRFVFWARDNFFDFDKAHRRKLTIACNQKQIDWILGYGFRYEDGVNTFERVQRIIERIKKIGYTHPKPMQSPMAPETFMKEIADVACNEPETKNSRGLILFMGHGGSPPEDVGANGLRLHVPGTDCLAFSPLYTTPRLGVVTEENKGCGKTYQSIGTWCRCPFDEIDIRDIKNYIYDQEKRQSSQPLSNIILFTLFGCFTYTDNKGDFASELNKLGINSILGIKFAIGRKFRYLSEWVRGFMEWLGLFEFIWEHLSHGATLDSAIEIASKQFSDYIYEKLIKEKIDLLDSLLIVKPPTRLCEEVQYGILLSNFNPSLKLKDCIKSIFKMTVNTDIRIIDPKDSRAQKLRKEDNCNLCIK